MIVTTAAADLELMRIAMLMDTDPAAAARAAAGLLARFPAHEGATLLMATACRRLGDPGTAVRVLEPLAAANPGSAAMQLEFGRALAADLRDAQARAAVEAAVALDPELADAWRELSRLRFRADDAHGGDLAYLEYARRASPPPELADAAVAIAENRLDTAERLLQGHLAVVPRDVHALRMLADVAFEREDFPTAEAKLRQCLDLEPGYGAARYDLARVLNAEQRSDEALRLLERLLAVDPTARAFRVLKAQALRFVNRIDEALALLEQVIADDPRDASSLVIFGGMLREVGQQARAIEAYRRSIELEPQSSDAYWSLANLKTFRFTAEDVAAMRRALAAAPELGINRIKLEFALAKALEDAGEYEKSFRHYAHGNGLYRGTIEYDPTPMTEDVRRCESVYTPRFFAERAGWGLETREPIFIVGIPRSGSTLLEQILASHSSVEGTRELPYLTSLVRDLAATAFREGRGAYPEFLTRMSREDIEAIGRRYLDMAARHRTLGRPRYVDKMLSNFGHVGLIQLMFPNATILDARRHPLACGFSCFKQMFARGLPFTYNLDEMGRYWRGYHDLMAHTDAVLPGRVYRVHYERLVAEPEAEVRRILDHCGLPFEPQCMRFYENSRKVSTVSSEQVRQPIYSEGVNQWRHYEEWLGPMAEALGPVVAEYPTFGSPDA
jgi:tetratricopeptide (TPR) repeat protein